MESVDAPVATHGRALSPGSRRITLVGTTLRVDGAAAGELSELSGPRLRSALAAASAREPTSVPVEVLVAPGTRVGVLRQILGHVAIAGHPVARILVHAAGAAGPKGAELRALDLDSMPYVADLPRAAEPPAPPPGEGPSLVGDSRSSAPPRALHVAPVDDRVLLVVRAGEKALASGDLPRPPGDASAGLPDLAAKVAALWGSYGQHRDAGDPDVDRAVLHSDDGEDVARLVAILDALAATTRLRGSEQVPAFRVALAPPQRRAPAAVPNARVHGEENAGGAPDPLGAAPPPGKVPVTIPLVVRPPE